MLKMRPVLQFHVLLLGPSFSCLAFSCPTISCPATWSVIFTSCIFSAPKPIYWPVHGRENVLASATGRVIMLNFIIIIIAVINASLSSIAQLTTHHGYQRHHHWACIITWWWPSNVPIQSTSVSSKWTKFELCIKLTPSTPTFPTCCCLKGSAPYWSNPPFLIFDIRALWRSGLSARAPECQKLQMVD